MRCPLIGLYTLIIIPILRIAPDIEVLKDELPLCFPCAEPFTCVLLISSTGQANKDKQLSMLTSANIDVAETLQQFKERYSRRIRRSN